MISVEATLWLVSDPTTPSENHLKGETGLFVRAGRVIVGHERRRGEHHVHPDFGHITRCDRGLSLFTAVLGGYWQPYAMLDEVQKVYTWQSSGAGGRGGGTGFGTGGSMRT